MRTALFVSLVVAVAGCKDKPKRKAPPPNVGTVTQAGKGPTPAPDLALPASDGSPIKKTTAPHTQADYERLAKLTYPGFELEQRLVGPKVFEIRQKTKDHPKLWATVTIQPCLDCVPMELAKWKAKEEELKVMLAPALKASKDVLFEVGETKLGTQPIIYTYQLGAAQGAPDKGGAPYSFTNAYVAYFNDGVNQIRVVAEYKDDPASVEDLKKKAPKDDLALLALSFLDVYAHAW